jgi:hypothetical protein
MGYKDKTWCTYYNNCKTPCDRALTDEVRAEAEKWMKNAPICQYTKKPECFKEIEDVG